MQADDRWDKAPQTDPSITLTRPLKALTGREVQMIDDLLKSVAPSGEVRLTFQKGRLRFIASTRNYNVHAAETAS